MSDDNPGRSLHFRIAMAARALRYSFDDRAASAGLTSAQWRTLAIVAADEGGTQRHIAKLLGVGDVTAGRMIDKLCEEGMVERRPCPADRRANRVFLTPRAAPILAAVQHLAEAEEQRAFAGLSEDDKDRLAAMLDRVLDNLRGALD